MVYFLTKNPNLGKFCRALDWKVLIYFMAIWNILQTFGIIYDPLVHFAFNLYIFSARSWYYARRKIWQPCRKGSRCRSSRHLSGRVTRWACERIAQSVAQKAQTINPFSSKKSFYVKKVAKKLRLLLLS
jgi:hypothetical protein